MGGYDMSEYTDQPRGRPRSRRHDPVKAWIIFESEPHYWHSTMHDKLCSFLSYQWYVVRRGPNGKFWKCCSKSKSSVAEQLSNTRAAMILTSTDHKVYVVRQR